MDFVVFVFIMIFCLCCFVHRSPEINSSLGQKQLPQKIQGDSVRHLEFVALLQLSHCVVGLCRWIDRLFSIFFAPASFEKKTDVSWKCGHVLGVDWWQRIYLRYKRYIQFNKYRSGWWHIDTSQMIITGILATDNETRSSFVEVSNHKSFRYRKCRYRTL